VGYSQVMQTIFGDWPGYFLSFFLRKAAKSLPVLEYWGPLLEYFFLYR